MKTFNKFAYPDGHLHALVFASQKRHFSARMLSFDHVRLHLHNSQGCAAMDLQRRGAPPNEDESPQVRIELLSQHTHGQRLT